MGCRHSVATSIVKLRRRRRRTVAGVVQLESDVVMSGMFGGHRKMATERHGIQNKVPYSSSLTGQQRKLVYGLIADMNPLEIQSQSPKPDLALC